MNTMPGQPSDCLFCAREDLPHLLFETPSLYVVPDRFPLFPGHLLAISKAHHRCYAVAPATVLRELEDASRRARRFLEDSYGGPVLMVENGIAGQSIFHAHLHLIPLPLAGGYFLPSDLARHDDIMAVEGWPSVRAYFERHGHYRYLEIGAHRYVIAGYSLALQALRMALAGATGLALNPGGFVKTTTPQDVQEVERRWHARHPPAR